MLREEPIESPDGESLEGVDETRISTGTISTDFGEGIFLRTSSLFAMLLILHKRGFPII